MKKENKDINITPEPSEIAKIIFREEEMIENFDAKFGKIFTKEENDIRKFILRQSPVLGDIPTIEHIKKEFTQLPDEKVDKILRKLDRFDVIHLNNDKTKIAAAYPFSGSKTSHIVTLINDRYKKIYSMCAVDALGVCFMFNCDVTIESHCHHCKEEMKIEIRDNKINFFKPKNIVVWYDREYSFCAAKSQCKNINFFSSEQHFNEWQKDKPRRKGILLQLQDAFYFGKKYFENRLKN